MTIEMDKLGRSLLELPRWTMAGAVIWRRADFKCEYCDTSLIDDHGTYRWGTPYDHILPQSKYVCLFTEPATMSWLIYSAADYRNIALSCHFCNLAKSSYDPGLGILEYNTVDVSVEQRLELVMRVREKVGERGRRQWKAAIAEFSEFRRIVALPAAESQ